MKFKTLIVGAILCSTVVLALPAQAGTSFSFGIYSGPGYYGHRGHPGYWRAPRYYPPPPRYYGWAVPHYHYYPKPYFYGGHGWGHSKRGYSKHRGYSRHYKQKPGHPHGGRGYWR